MPSPATERGAAPAVAIASQIVAELSVRPGQVQATIDLLETGATVPFGARYRTATFREGFESIADLQPGMLLEGVVTNVNNFGAFVDIGAHQDGLVHVSQLADRAVRDPREVVKAGDIVRARVVEVDAARKRIGLTMRSEIRRWQGCLGLS